LLNRPRRKFVELPHRNNRWHGGPRRFQGPYLTAIRDRPLHGRPLHFTGKARR
jgi:hypothetical protein